MLGVTEETLAQWLAGNRARRKLSQKELSERSGVGQSYIAKIENGGAKNVDPEIIEKLARGLSVPVQAGLDAAAVTAGYRGRDVPEPMTEEITTPSGVLITIHGLDAPLGEKERERFGALSDAFLKTHRHEGQERN